MAQSSYFHVSLALAFLLLVTTVLGTSVGVNDTEPLVIAAAASAQVVKDVAPAVGVVEVMGKLYNAYLFVARAALFLTAWLFFLPDSMEPDL
ncbi:hypothetical protein HDU98_005214 [Podochytrium sp. JEL0797]|nr:hypothetical protein HDU98_005214 [Podochytrium sp. JEL0797]